MVGVTTPCEGGRLGRSSPDDAALTGTFCTKWKEREST